MSGITTAHANRELNWRKGTAYPAPPATWYIALFTTAPGPNSEGTEVTGGGYARRSITAATGFSGITGSLPGSRRQITNAGDVIWATATTDWGLIVGWASYDASTAGYRDYYEAIPTGKQQTIVAGNVFKVLAGQLVFWAS